MEAPGGADALSALARDHRRIQSYFARMNGAVGSEELRALTEAAISELVRHTVAEEMYLGPAIREHLPDGDVLADREMADHAAMERTLRLLERADVADDRFLPLLHGLIRDAEAHFGTEENVLFPLLIEYIDPGELRTLGRLIQRLHPPPSTPPAGTSLIDHVRRSTARTATR